jgi:drug/metabolite transporter (DMT)-like permease
VIRGSRLALAYIVVAAAASSWGTWALTLRHTEALAPLPPQLETTVVFAVMTAVAWVVARVDRTGVRPDRASMIAVIWLGVSDALNVALYFAAVRISATVAVLTHYLTPLLVAAASPLVLRERLARKTALAVLLSLLGLGVMLAPDGERASSSSLGWCASLGAGSAVFYASNVIINKVVARAYSPSEAMLWHCVVATPLLAALVPVDAWRVADPKAISFLALVAVGPGALAGLAFVWGLRRMPAAHASTLTLLEPLVAVFIAVSVLGEPLSVHVVVGGVLILAGSAAVMAAPVPPKAPFPESLGRPLPR